jgi:stearoyl-CoA desaturase (delta-9 desaturase)
LKEEPLVKLHHRSEALVAVGLVLPAVIDGLVRMNGWGLLAGLLWGGYLRMFAVEQVVCLVNSWCHWRGTRPFVTRDHSANVPLVGVLALGEGWHNNHHAFPASARQGLDPGQLDLTYMAIKLWVALGWARHPVVPDHLAIEAKRQASCS